MNPDLQNAVCRLIDAGCHYRLDALTAMHRTNDLGGAALEQRIDLFFTLRTWAGTPAPGEVLAVARWVAQSRAGNGALRELADFLLASRGERDGLLARYRLAPARPDATA